MAHAQPVASSQPVHLSPAFVHRAHRRDSPSQPDSLYQLKYSSRSASIDPTAAGTLFIAPATSSSDARDQIWAAFPTKSPGVGKNKHKSQETRFTATETVAKQVEVVLVWDDDRQSWSLEPLSAHLSLKPDRSARPPPTPPIPTPAQLHSSHASFFTSDEVDPFTAFRAVTQAPSAVSVPALSAARTPPRTISRPSSSGGLADLLNPATSPSIAQLAASNATSDNDDDDDDFDEIALPVVPTVPGYLRQPATVAAATTEVEDFGDISGGMQSLPRPPRSPPRVATPSAPGPSLQATDATGTAATRKRASPPASASQPAAKRSPPSSTARIAAPSSPSAIEPKGVAASATRAPVPPPSQQQRQPAIPHPQYSAPHPRYAGKIPASSTPTSGGKANPEASAASSSVHPVASVPVPGQPAAPPSPPRPPRSPHLSQGPPGGRGSPHPSFSSKIPASYSRQLAAQNGLPGAPGQGQAVSGPGADEVSSGDDDLDGGDTDDSLDDDDDDLMEAVAVPPRPGWGKGGGKGGKPPVPAGAGTGASRANTQDPPPPTSVGPAGSTGPVAHRVDDAAQQKVRTAGTASVEIGRTAGKRLPAAAGSASTSSSAAPVPHASAGSMNKPTPGAKGGKGMHRVAPNISDSSSSGTDDDDDDDEEEESDDSAAGTTTTLPSMLSHAVNAQMAKVRSSGGPAPSGRQGSAPAPSASRTASVPSSSVAAAAAAARAATGSPAPPPSTHDYPSIRTAAAVQQQAKAHARLAQLQAEAKRAQALEQAKRDRARADAARSGTGSGAGQGLPRAAGKGVDPLLAERENDIPDSSEEE